MSAANNTTKASSDDMTKLYHQALMQHHKQPIGYELKLLATNISSAEGENPACGDEITVNVSVDSERVNEIGFSGDSCAICRASASMMCQSVAGKPVSQVVEMSHAVHHAFINHELFEGNLSPLNSVFSLPIRQQCALLPWHTLRLAIENKTS